MKKILCILLTAAVILTIAVGCVKTGENDDIGKNSSESSEEKFAQPDREEDAKDDVYDKQVEDENENVNNDAETDYMSENNEYAGTIAEYQLELIERANEILGYDGETFEYTSQSLGITLVMPAQWQDKLEIEVGKPFAGGGYDVIYMKDIYVADDSVDDAVSLAVVYKFDRADWEKTVDHKGSISTLPQSIPRNIFGSGKNVEIASNDSYSVVAWLPYLYTDFLTDSDEQAIYMAMIYGLEINLCDVIFN